MVKAIVGANWGDEGKGKITDFYAGQADIVVRFQGGANAGHTIINNYGKFALHLLPSGVFQPDTTNVIGNGVALDIRKLAKEYDSIVAAGVPAPKLLVSERAQVMLPVHILLDTYEEARLADKAFGSTKSGISPFYADKYAKIGLQVCELFDEEILRERVHKITQYKNLIIQHVYHQELIDEDALLAELHEQRDLIAPFKADTAQFLRTADKAGKQILLEGQLGSLKDPDAGIYPMVTSSSTLAGYGAVGAGVAPWAIREVIVVTKAYSSAVGAGEFVSEIFDDEADAMRNHGGDAGEYGATTGRPRRMGWFDAVASRYGCAVQGATGVVLTAIDCLNYLDEIKVCVGYEIDGVVTRDFPVTPLLRKAKPVYVTLPGFPGAELRGAKTFAELPQTAQDYVRFIEKELEVPVTLVSVGPRREELIDLTAHA
ncbi:MAG: adenylosuccinate synthase [Oscillospiraceae bacterium]|jgi:adenylosuccinate synthase|nr:adenylosuccinate synthase [Oscillospiraceae bacterium]